MTPDADRHVLWMILDFYPDFTGHGIYLTKIDRFLRPADYRFTVLTRSYGASEPGDECFGDLPVRRFPLPCESSLSFLLFCLRSISYMVSIRKTFSILHLHGFHDRFGLFALFTRLFRKRLITQLVAYKHDDPPTYLQTYNLRGLRRRMLHAPDAYITISTPLTNACVTVGIERSKVFQIAQGVDVSRFMPAHTSEEKQQLKSELDIARFERVAIFVGAVLEAKGVRELIQAWSAVQRDNPNALLMIVGPYRFGTATRPSRLDDLVDELRDVVDRKGLNVLFTGRVDSVERYLQAADVFVFPSRREGFGNVIIEAMACGLPCVVSPMDGVAGDSVIHGKTGFIAEDVETLAESVLLLLGDPDKCREMGERGRLRVQEHFSMEIIAARYVDLYRQLTDVGLVGGKANT